MSEQPKQDRWSKLADLFGLASSNSPPPEAKPESTEPPSILDSFGTPELQREVSGADLLFGSEVDAEEASSEESLNDTVSDVSSSAPPPPPAAAPRTVSRWASIANALGLNVPEEPVAPSVAEVVPPHTVSSPPPVAPPAPRAETPPQRSGPTSSPRPKRSFAADIFSFEEEPAAEVDPPVPPPAHAFERERAFDEPAEEGFSEQDLPRAEVSDDDFDRDPLPPRREETSEEPRRRRRRRRGRRRDAVVENDVESFDSVEDDVSHDDVRIRANEDAYTSRDADYESAEEMPVASYDAENDELDEELPSSRRDEEGTGRRRRRRRRRGGERDRSTPDNQQEQPESFERSENTRERHRARHGNRAPQTDDLEEVGDELPVSDHAHRSFPTWLETVEVLVNANIAQRETRGPGRNPRGSRGGRGGRGRG